MTNINPITQAVCKLVNKHGTRDPFEICFCLDINIHRMELGPALKAYYFCHSRIKNIVINADSSDVIQRVLCAHELGHAVLHGKLAALRGFHELSMYDAVSRTEYEANLFAAELLIEDEELFSLLKTDGVSFYDVAKELYVPPELLDFKFKALESNGVPVKVPHIARSDFLKNDIPGCFDDF